MAEQDKKDLDIKNLDVAELTDDDLENASGGVFQDVDTTNSCPIENYNC